MDNRSIFESFREYLKKLFPKRANPITGEAEYLAAPEFEDTRFNEWRKNK